MSQSSGPQTGYFVIADISGYTKFLSTSEIEHAKGILDDLFRAIIPVISAPLSISGFQGDAVFAYAVDSDIVSGQVIVDAVERIYCVFADRREHMRRNTSCTCNACANIAELDLKIIVHHGEYVAQSLDGRSELAGRDVIAAFRLLKNTVEKELGLTGYALITMEALRTMGMAPLFAQGAHRRTSFEHIGDIEYVVHALHPVWEKKRDARRVFVGPDGPLLVPEGSVVVPVPPQVAFVVATRPDMRARWLAVNRIEVVSGHARLEAETVMHCHHGGQPLHFEIVDWRPGEYFTGRYRVMGATVDETMEFSRLGEGTRVARRFGELAAAHGLVGRLMAPLLRRSFAKEVSKAMPGQLRSLRDMCAEIVREVPVGLADREPDVAALGLEDVLEKRFAA